MLTPEDGSHAYDINWMNPELVKKWTLFERINAA